MSQTETEQPEVTIVVVPRDHFSTAKEALESVLEHTDVPFKLVYVDGRPPNAIRSYLRKRAREASFELVESPHFLTCTQARNAGLRRADTEFVAFLDNDVVVAPGWLGPLVQCAKETGADLVAPLICQKRPLHTEIHCTTGDTAITLKDGEHGPLRVLTEKLYDQGTPVADLRPSLSRTPCSLIECHAFFARRSVFEKMGPFDEGLRNTKEHVDMCLAAEKVGAKIVFEPASIVTFCPPPPYALSDLPFFMVRWSESWEEQSLDHLRKKWNLTDDTYFQWRANMRGWRRQTVTLRPIVDKWPLKRGKNAFKKILSPIERRINRMYCKALGLYAPRPVKD